VYDKARERKLCAVECRRDLVCFAVLDVAGPDYDVVFRVPHEIYELLREQSVADKGCGFVVLGGYKYDEKELEVLLGKIECLRVAALEERHLVWSIFLLKLPYEPRSCVSWV
jgi:hypothetical protein